MKIEMKLYQGYATLGTPSYYSTPVTTFETVVMCHHVLEEYFGFLPKLITLVLDTEEHKQAYRVKFTKDVHDELTVFDDGARSAVIGRHATYLGLDVLLERFPNCTAWLSIELGHE